MRGFFKAKDTYKDAPDSESYKGVSYWKHNALLNGEVVYLDTCPRLLGGKDLGQNLIACNEDGSSSSSSGSSKSSDPSDNWTKEELKEYMIDNSIAFNSGDTKQDLLDKINAEGGKE